MKYFVCAGISVAELARRIGCKPSTFHRRMQTGRLSLLELEAMVEVTGCKYVQHYELPNGEKIRYEGTVI